MSGETFCLDWQLGACFCRAGRCWTWRSRWDEGEEDGGGLLGGLLLVR